MFDVGPLEMVTLVVLAVVVFGPDKLPHVTAKAARTLREVRAFRDATREELLRTVKEADDLGLDELTEIAKT